MANIGHLPEGVRENFWEIAHRALWGILGGAIATVSKFLAQDLHWYRIFRATKEFEAIDGMMWTYILLALCLCFIGGVVAAAFQGEKHPMKLLGLGVAAPALVTTWLGGQYAADAQNQTKSSWLPSLVSTAYAADMSVQSNGFWRGAGIVFGIGKDQTRFHVVVASYPTRGEATAMLEKVHKLLPDLNVYIAEPRAGNNFYAVIVGSDLPFSEAQELRDEISEKLNVKDTYLSRAS